MGNVTQNQQTHALVASTLGWLLDGLDFTVLTFIIPTLILVFHSSLVAMSLVLTATLIAKVIGNILFGWLADLYGRKVMFLIGVIWFSTFSGISALSWNYLSLMSFRIIFGIGFGGQWSAAAALLMETTGQKRRGLFSGIMMSGWEMGYLVAAGAFATLFVMAGAYGWRVMFLVGVIPGALLALYIYTKVKESPIFLAKKEKKETEKKERYKLEWKGLQGWLFMGAINFLSYAIFSLYPTYLETIRHLTPAEVFPFIALYSVASIIGKPFAGTLANRFGNRAVLIVYSLLTIPIPFLYVMSPAYALMGAGASLIGFIPNSMFGLVPKYLSVRFKDEYRSFGMGTGYAVAGATGALAPYIVAVTSLKYGLAVSMLMWIIIAAVITFIIVLPRVKEYEITVYN